MQKKKGGRAPKVSTNIERNEEMKLEVARGNILSQRSPLEFSDLPVYMDTGDKSFPCTAMSH